MKLPKLQIGDKIAKYPIIQGGMGIGVSGSKLAGTVAECGGVGIISTANIGYKEEDFKRDNLNANLRAMDKEIDKAREISPNGILGINIMVAVNNYSEMVRKVVSKGIDLIISGAGLPKNLPELVQGTKTKIAPIISSARGAILITKMWIKKYNYVPDMIVIEGPEAGGHLGFSIEELTDEEKKPKLEQILKEVKEEMKKFEEECKKKIQIVVAGGIYTGKDIAKFLKLGADAVQIGTRFVATEECDASEEYKQTYIDCKKEDIKIIKSPVGLPGRAINNDFMKKVEQGKQKITNCTKCIRTCDGLNTPYCITTALVNAVKGNVNDALLFCGSNAYRIDKITTVKELMNELVSEAELEYSV